MEPAVEVADWGARLNDPRAFGLAPGTCVERLETHISWLFFAGGRVHKVKKPVDLGFLDFSTLERRRHACEEEVRLNRRLAPGVYLGVVGIGWRAAPGGAGGGHWEVGCEPAVEFAVRMRELPRASMLERKLERGEVDAALIEDLARLLARFHADAATGPGVDEHGLPAAVARNVLDNVRSIRSLTPALLPPDLSAVPLDLLARLAVLEREFLSRAAELLARRVASGRIREGHGDLHAGNVCCTPQGIVAYDCLEFSAALRCCDVACDLAFLCMDLDRLGYRAFSADLARRYAERAGDPELPLLMRFYKRYRALVRAKVALLRARGAMQRPAEARVDAKAGADPQTQEPHVDEAWEYLALAAAEALPPCLILTCGLPASGKSTVARAVARPLEAWLGRSDLLRKRLFGLAPDARPTAAQKARLYAPQAVERVYGELLAQAAAALRSGRSAVVDATFSTRARRRPFLELARREGVPLLVLWTCAGEEVVRARMQRRALDPSDASDADLEVYRAARARFEPPQSAAGGELEDAQLVRLEAGRDPTALATLAALERLMRAPARVAGARIAPYLEPSADSGDEPGPDGQSVPNPVDDPDPRSA